MTKYLESERFIVNSNTKESIKNYADNYDRIFGEKAEPSASPDVIGCRLYAEIHRVERPPTIGQYDDGTWYWLDEMWGYGNDVHYATREEAQKAQDDYCDIVLGR